MRWFLRFHEVMDQAVEQRLRERYGSDAGALESLGFTKVCAYAQVLFPLSLIVFPVLVGFLLFEELAQVTWSLGAKSFHLLLRSPNSKTLVAFAGVGTEFSTLFDDGTLLITSNAQSDQTDRNRGKRLKHYVEGSISKVWGVHENRISNLESSGKSALTANGWKEFREHSSVDLEAESSNLLWIVLAIQAAAVLALWLLFICVKFCVTSFPLLTLILVVGIPALVIWSGRGIRALQGAVEKRTNFEFVEPNLPSRKCKERHRELLTQIEDLHFTDIIHVDNNLYGALGIATFHSIAIHPNGNIIAYITLNQNTRLLRALSNLLRYGSLKQSSLFISFETVLADYSNFSTFEAPVKQAAYATGETLHEHLALVPYGTNAKAMLEAHEKRLAELVSQKGFKPAVFKNSRDVLTVLEKRYSKAKKEWRDVLSALDSRNCNRSDFVGGPPIEKSPETREDLDPRDEL